MVISRRGEYKVAIAQAGGQWFFDQNVDARSGGLDHWLGMKWVRGGNADGLDATLREHPRHMAVRFHPETLGK